MGLSVAGMRASRRCLLTRKLANPPYVSKDIKMKICKKCGGMEFYAGSHCKHCLKVTMNKCRTANPEMYKETGRAWRKAHPAEMKAQHDKQYAANSEEIKAKARARYRANREARLVAVRKWQSANPDKYKDSMRRARENRRARKLGNGGVLSKWIVAKLFKLQRGKCACCSLPLGADYHLDHIMPLALGGKNDDRNVQLLRRHCNNEKHAKHPVDFMQSRGFLL